VNLPAANGSCESTSNRECGEPHEYLENHIATTKESKEKIEGCGSCGKRLGELR